MSRTSTYPTIWDLSSLATNDTDAGLQQTQQDAQSAIKTFVNNWRDNQDFISQPKVLLRAITDYEQLMTNHGPNSQQWYYFHLRTAQDQLDPVLKGLSIAADQTATDLINQIQFFSLRLSKISLEDQNKHLAYQPLAPYHHFLKKLFDQGKYALSEDEEKILNLSQTSSHDAWVRMTATFLAQYTVKTLVEDGSRANKTLPELLSLSSHQDKKVRDSAAKHIHALTAKYAPVATEELNAILSYKTMTDQLRGFSRPDQSRHISDDINSAVVDAMLQAVEQRFGLAHRFYALKAKLLGQTKLAYHERNVEYGHLIQAYSFDKSISTVMHVFGQLDSEFKSILKRLANQGQLDVYPRLGKSGGAFCAHMLISQPTYVLLNHTDRLQDVLTLAHEMGHAINNELMRQKQTALNFETPLATAEVASTFMEDFVLQHISNNSKPDTQLAINMMKLNDDISSIFRQVAAYRFEQELHQQHAHHTYLSRDQIGLIFERHMASYMGPAVQQSKGSQNWWVYWGHFRSFFYVYSYASGLLISKSLQEMVRAEPTSIMQVKEFLAAGSSDSPAAIFKKLGIAIDQADFWQRGLDSIEQLLTQTESLAQQLLI